MLVAVSVLVLVCDLIYMFDVVFTLALIAVGVFVMDVDSSLMSGVCHGYHIYVCCYVDVWFGYCY